MVEFELWWLLIIPFFFALGWISARIDIKHIISETTDLPVSYFKGLNYILFQEYEKASESFSDALRIKPDSLELHFIQGNILRKLGKIDQAINLHNKLLNQKELTDQQIESVKAELIQDFFTAGFYDRCEKLINEISNNQYEEFNLNILLDISIKQRNWSSAVKYSFEIEKKFGKSQRLQVSHFYCELALEELVKNKKVQSVKNLEKALEINKNNTRANIIMGEIEFEQKKYVNAIEFWKKIEFQKPEHFVLIVKKFLDSYDQLNKTNECLSQLSHYRESYQIDQIDKYIFDYVFTKNGAEKAEELARNNLIKKPSIEVLDQLFSAQASKDNKNQDIKIIQQIVKNTIGNRLFHICNHCGFKARQHHWQCPACNSWETLSTELIDSTK
jgi:lipopolysaccharide biosynthesis regulator YciM